MRYDTTMVCFSFCFLISSFTNNLSLHVNIQQVPERVRGYMFEYELVKVSRSGAFMKYTDRVYKKGADSFEIFKETVETQVMPFPVSGLDDAHEVWMKALGHTNGVAYIERQKKEAIAKSTGGLSASEANFDMSDLDDLFSIHGRGTYLFEVDFEPDTPEPIPYLTPKGEQSSFWAWSHKITGKSCKRFQAKSGKSFDTGKLSKYLQTLSKDSSQQLASARAKKILVLAGVLTERGQGTKESPILVPTLGRRELLLQQVRRIWLSLLQIRFFCFLHVVVVSIR